MNTTTAPRGEAARGAPETPGRRARFGPLGLAAPAAGWMLVFVAAPVVVLLAYAFLTAGYFTVTGPVTFDNFTKLIDSDLTWTLASNSVAVGLFTTVVCMLVAVPVAHWLRYSAGRWQMPVLFLITTSMFASYLVRIYAWRTILGERGVLNSALQDLGITNDPLTVFIFNRTAVVIAMVHIVLPYVILITYTSLRPLEPRYLEAAGDLGAGAVARWRRVILPLLAAPLASAGLFAFILSSADYVTAQFLGGPKDSMLGVQISNQFSAAGNYAAGSAMSVMLLAVYGIGFAIISFGLRRARVNDVRWTT